MPLSHPAVVIDAATALAGGEQAQFPFEQYALRALAQGDSWFSIGAIPPGRTTNLLLEMRGARRMVIVQCAVPGEVLSRFTDTSRAQGFLDLLARPPYRNRWDAILVSGGGNDLIDAAGSPPSAPAHLRLLRTAAERGPNPGSAAACISEPGWATFATHLGAVFDRLVDTRDAGPNRGVPLLMHNYARVMPRPSPAGLGQGPWLQPAFDAYAVPQGLRLALADELLRRLSALLQQLMERRRRKDRQANLHLVDTLGRAGVVLSVPGTTGSSGDWVNEIHLTRAGYRKCTAIWAEALDALPLAD
jgi:hypothetical protein